MSERILPTPEGLSPLLTTEELRLCRMLSQGLSQAQVASVLGKSPGRISQLLQEPRIQDKLRELHADQASAPMEKVENQALDARYTSLEHKILNTLELALPQAESLSELTKALQVVATRQVQVREQAEKAQARLLSPSLLGSQGLLNGAVLNTQVILNLPSHAISSQLPALDISSQREIIGVDGKSLAPLSSEGVINLFTAKGAEREVENVEPILHDTASPDAEQALPIPLQDGPEQENSDESSSGKSLAPSQSSSTSLNKGSSEAEGAAGLLALLRAKKTMKESSGG